MIIADIISSLRRDLNDRFKRGIDTFDGDGATEVFQVSKFPIRASGFNVFVGGVLQVEATDFTLDLDRGLLDFAIGGAPAAGTKNIEIRYDHARWQDEDYLEILNDGIDHLKDTFWEEFTDEGTITSVRDKRVYPLLTVDANIFSLISVEISPSTSTVPFASLASITNWIYKPQNNELHINKALHQDGQSFRFVGLRRFTKETNTGATFPVPDRYILPYKYYAKMRFMEGIANEKVDSEGAVTTNARFLPASAAFNVMELYNDKMNDIAKKIAPKMPPIAIKQQQEGSSA